MTVRATNALNGYLRLLPLKKLVVLPSNQSLRFITKLSEYPKRHKIRFALLIHYSVRRKTRPKSRPNWWLRTFNYLKAFLLSAFLDYSTFLSNRHGPFLNQKLISMVKNFWVISIWTTFMDDIICDKVPPQYVAWQWP